MARSVDVARILDEFNFHQVDKDGVENMDVVREFAQRFAEVILTYCDEDCPEKEIALQRVREAMFWANAGISSSYPPVEPRVDGIGKI